MTSGRIFGSSGGGRGSGSEGFGAPLANQADDPRIISHNELRANLKNIQSLSEFGQALPSQIKAAALAHNDSQSSQFGIQDLDTALKSKSWLHTTVFERIFTPGTADLGATLTIPESPSKELPTTINPFHTKDLLATLSSIPPEDLGASVSLVEPVDLPASILSIASVDLSAFAGAHPPADLSAFMSITQPENIPAFIRGGFSDNLDLGATITQTGGFKDLPVHIKLLQSTIKDLSASITARVPLDLPATIAGFVEKDLPAILITERIFNMRAIVKGFVREAEANLGAFLRRVDSGTKDLPVDPMRAIISTHTNTGKLPNLDRVSRPFFQNIYGFGTQSAGFFVLTLEPIFGNFPDLAASIIAIDFFRKNLGAFVRAATRQEKDLSTNLVSVTPSININKIELSLVPLKNIAASLNPSGGFLGLKTNIKPVHSSSTGTDPNARFITTATSFRFFLGTTKGLFIPPQISQKIRTTSFINPHPRPDLRASIAGWGAFNLGAYIKDYPFFPISASLNPWTLDHIKDFPGTLIPAHLFDLAASITTKGGFESLGASVSPAGQISSLPATLVAFIDPLSFDVVPVSTKPFNNLAATINYDPFVRCAPISAIKTLGAFLKPLFTTATSGGVNLQATLNALSGVGDMGASVVARKVSRIRLAGLSFRAVVSATEAVRASIIPVIPTDEDLAATIQGLSHEFDLEASLTAVRYSTPNIVFERYENVVNLEDPDEVKRILLSFRTQVSTYVFEDVSSSVYPTDQGTWAIDLRTLLRDESFFDRSPKNREFALTDISEFYTLDEAIRNAIVILCERRQVNIGASLTASGAIENISAAIGVVSADRILSLPTSLVAVGNSPDISASINLGPGGSGWSFLNSVISPIYSEQQSSISAEVFGTIQDDLSASITAT